MKCCPPKGKHPTYNQTNSSNLVSVGEFSVASMLISTAFFRMGSDQKVDRKDPCLDQRDQRSYSWPAVESAFPFFGNEVWTLISGWYPSREMCWIYWWLFGSELSALNSQWSGANFPCAARSVRTKKPRRMKLRNPRNSADWETILNRTPGPIQTLDQIRLERLLIEDAPPA